MVMDEGRREAYLSVVSRYAKGARVLDLGCGTGFFTLAALRAGARSVTAIDLLDPVQLLPSIVKLNGYEGRCEVYQGDIRELSLDSSFDLIISDMRGSTPFFQDHFDVLDYAKHNLLADNGCITPGTDKMMVALVSWESQYEKLCAPWKLDNHDWSTVLKSALRTPFRVGDCPENCVMGSPVKWAEIDYVGSEISKQKHWGGQFDITVPTAGCGHGLMVWFETIVLDELSYSNAPDCGRMPTYGRQYFPFDRPYICEANSKQTITIQCHSTAAQWHWEWGISGADGKIMHNTLDSLNIGDVIPVSTKADQSVKRLL